MTECERLQGSAPGLAALRPDAPERIAAWEHARGCPACRRALGEAQRLHALAAKWEAPPPPPEALERASAAIVAELRGEARRRSLGTIAAACVAFAALLVMARHPSHLAEDWTLATVLAAGAVALAGAAHRRGRLVVGAAAVAALSAALSVGRGDALVASTGLDCIASELAAAAMAVGATWLAIRGGTTSPARSSFAAAAAAGGLAAYAGLQITCTARDAIPHLLVFHVGGLILAAAAASLLHRRVRRVDG